jgi:hypothetical protein
MLSLTQIDTHVYSRTTRALHDLLTYALSHPEHSAQWIGAIALLLGKEMSHG